MSEITDTGREELKRAYDIATEGEHDNLHVYIGLDDGSEAICEIFADGTVHVEHPNGYHTGMFDATMIPAQGFVARVRELIEQ